MAEVAVTGAWSDAITVTEVHVLQAVGGRVAVYPDSDTPSGPGIVIREEPVQFGPGSFRVRSPDGAATLVHYEWPIGE